jgi:hypothetical protein
VDVDLDEIDKGHLHDYVAIEEAFLESGYVAKGGV